MAKQLNIKIGQYTHQGRKERNQDYYGACIPKEPQLSSKGIAIALADGISSSNVSQIASETSVNGFLADYYCTSDAWSVKKSGQSVLRATNTWLHSQTRRSEYRYEMDKGYVCAFSALVIKSHTAYLFHVGDTRIYRLRSKDWEQLTRDHRVWVSGDKSYLSQAMGISAKLEMDYAEQPVEKGDIFILASDGVYEFTDKHSIIDFINEAEDLDQAARNIIDDALHKGSDDNLTVQIVLVDDLPEKNASEIARQIDELPFPPQLRPRMEFDGYKILREIHYTSRSHVYLAVDMETDTKVVIKAPSDDLKNDPVYLERLLMEEWIARRLDSAHVLKSFLATRKRNYLYIVTEYIEGITLTQWMHDNPKPGLDQVRDIIEQISKGLQAFSRKEMLHQDLRPNNVMIDSKGTVKIIDFGSTRVAGLLEVSNAILPEDILGTAQFTAPEYFLGLGGNPYSDQFSLGIITYQMLSGRLPYGTHVARAKTKAAQKKLRYQTVLSEDRDIPAWVDDAIRKAVHPDPYQRYEVLSEFILDLHQPSKRFLNSTKAPLMERNPVLFWKSVSLVLAIIVVFLIFQQHS